MKLKTKIQMALLVVFTGFAVLGAVNGYYLDKIAKKSALMMRENYRSLNYTHEMSLALEDVISAITLRETSYSYKRAKLREAFDKFERYMSLQNQNIADQGEEELTIQLIEAFEDFRNETETNLRKEEGLNMPLHMQSVNIRNLLNKVYLRNEESIQRTTDEANRMIGRVTLYIIILGFFIFLGAVAAMFYLPDLVAQPIKDMTESMKRIARREYGERLPINTNDEFGEMALSFNLMSEKLEDYEAYNLEQLMSEKTRIETLISRMKAAIVGVDKNGTFIFANPVAERLLGLREEEIKGQNVQEVEDVFLREMTQEIRENKLVEDKSYPSLKLEKNGRSLFFSKDILVVKVPSEGSVEEADYGWVIVLKNITKLTEENIAKTNFMARLSHELKTPIAAIDMSVGLLKDERIGEINEEQTELTETIKQNTNRMIIMVNEILDMAKLETGNVRLNIKVTPPEKVVNSAVSSVKAFLEQKNIKVKIDIEEDLPKIKMDAEKTSDVLVNFLTNAIRYTNKKGRIGISVSSLVDTVVFSVKDYGKGIPEKELEVVFQKFTRSEGDNTKGTGLGLAISKEFVEMQGGRVWAESELGKGSVFNFALPIV